MESPILFKEKQRFTQWWLWAIMIGVNALLIFGVVQQIVLKQPFGDKPSDDFGLLYIAGAMLLLTILFSFSKLETEITKDGISVRLSPFHIRFKKYNWDQFSKVYLREYSPITEYGGWGIRYSISGSGKAFNISGNKGLQLEFKTGKKLLIGTQKMAELHGVISNLSAVKNLH